MDQKKTYFTLLKETYEGDLFVVAENVYYVDVDYNSRFIEDILFYKNTMSPPSSFILCDYDPEVFEITTVGYFSDDCFSVSVYNIQTDTTWNYCLGYPFKFKELEWPKKKDTSKRHIALYESSVSGYLYISEKNIAQQISFSEGQFFIKDLFSILDKPLSYGISLEFLKDEKEEIAYFNRGVLDLYPLKMGKTGQIYCFGKCINFEKEKEAKC